MSTYSDLIEMRSNFLDECINLRNKVGMEFNFENYYDKYELEVQKLIDTKYGGINPVEGLPLTSVEPEDVD
jgi:hypothetical protein